ncbi:MAG: hypothetical protein A2939_00870 [Parcubacteria group bacterium RIFCSPLOWO2_01_FULL_48_18]|nr:MAG: hypothetical protein A3J67_04510 [Parcubacteria group bacterium RIFCSPHIGHO2_02_FULL_48_10b]OHB22028.1 MAG: hypothetical protein A2939_00870 [Parcubacteria group bacterium RIFCSPLOWO2_01_FULL_48_18]
MKKSSSMRNEKTSMIKISPSGIGYLMECPRCLWLFVNESVNRPRGIFPSLPDGMDNVFKEYFDVHRKDGTLPPEIDGKIDAKLFADMEKLEKWRNIDFGRGGLRAEFPEYNIFLRGAIDDLLVDADGKYILFDFKTRGYPTKEDTHEHYRNQLDLYGLLFEKNNLPLADVGYLLFFWPSSYKQNEACFETELVPMNINPERGYSILKKVSDIVSGPKPGAHERCEYCVYRGD